VKNILDLSHLIMSCENAVPSFRFHEWKFKLWKNKKVSRKQIED
jgi:hypothetical protein